MKLNRAAIWIVTALSAAAPASAQVAADLVAEAGIPAGNIFAPHTPAVMIIIGGILWVGEEAQGLRHYIPIRIVSIRSTPAIPDRYLSKTDGVVLAAA